jgi:hypothetical protein
MPRVLPQDIERRLDVYRQHRKDETGKRPFRDTAILELLRKALEGIEQPKPLTQRIEALEQRIEHLEGVVAEIEIDLGQ